MEAEEITKLVDGVYKNILDKFNPGARQLITAGKGYLKALHGAATASRQFNEALAKIAVNAQQSGTSDIGAALMNVVSVYKEIQDQQMNILKAFYVDLLVPLETNLEKDTKVVQHEQKKFMQQHKVRMESYQKAVTTMKKQRKKKATPENTEKELRSLQLLEDQKKKLDAFCEQSYKNAMTQERRRYGFVLERQCSIAKHWMAYHTTGKNAIDSKLENWEEIAASREIIPTAAYESSFSSKRMERIKDVDDGTHHTISNGSSQLKKARSVDAPYGDMRTLHETTTNYSQNSLPRAKSDFNLQTTTATTSSNDHVDHHGHWDQRPVVKALYAYMPSGENQLPFDEGDNIALVGSKAKGWQFGENLRTQMFGWFPIAYTNGSAGDTSSIEHHERNDYSRERYENMHYERNSRGGVGSGYTGGGGSSGMRSYQEHQYMSELHGDNALESDSTYRRRNNSAEESSPTRMFGDTINFRNQKKYRASTGANPRPGPPPTLPAPVPSVSQTTQSRILNSSQSFCAPNGVSSVLERRKQKALNGPQAPHNRSMLSHMKQSSSMGHMTGSNIGNQTKPAAAAKTSLHSSNDSGFANEPPPQPEIDYSDEEQTNRVPIRRRAETNSHSSREVASWTLNRNFRNSVDSQIDDKSLNAFGVGGKNGGKMRYDLIASDDEILQASSGGIKRTKSFWKFGGGRNEDILAGMSLWQHRDLVAAPNLEELRQDDQQQQVHQQQQQQTPRPDSSQNERDFDKNGTLTKSNSNNSSTPSSRNDKRRKESITSLEAYDDDDENLYGINPIAEQQQFEAQQKQQAQQLQMQQRNSMTTSMVANYTPKSRMKIMKTIEIDIENPTENERLSTLKRGQKEYQRDMREMTPQKQHQQHTLPNMKHKQQSQQHQSQQQQRNFIAKNNSKIVAGNVNTNQRNKSSMPQAPSSSQQQHHHDMMLHSTEDEDASDDNGTLKMSDVNNFFDDLPHDGHGNAGGMIMKTVKRKDILKQYYTSEDEESDDAEIKSTSSDPYDCIVINDHLVRKDEKYRRGQQHPHQQQQQQQHLNSYHQEQHQMEFQTFRATTKKSSTTAGQTTSNEMLLTNKTTKKSNSKQQQQQQQQQNNNSHMSATSSANNSAMSTPTATILPRTRLMKSSSTTLERTQQKSKSIRNPNDVNGERGERGERGSDKEKSHYGNKTYGPWYDFWDPQEQHTSMPNRKSMNNTKIK